MQQARPTWDAPSLRRYSDVKTDQDGLKILALQGCWSEVVDRLRLAAERPREMSREESLSFAAYHVLALVKLRQYTVASRVMETLGDLDAPDKQDAQNTNLVPFALRWLAAELPHRLGNTSATQDALYRLTQLCETEALHAQEREGSSEGQHAGILGQDMSEMPALGTMGEVFETSPGVPSSIWWRRYEAVGLAITNHHLRLKQHIPALQWLRRLEMRRKRNPKLLSMVGYVQMMLGDLAAAEATFSTVAKLGSSESEILTRRNRSLLLFSRRRYRESQEELQWVVQSFPGDSVAVNNHAISQMYCCDLVGGIHALEDCLQSRPLEHTSEPMMMTLTLMYELSLASAAADAKRKVSQWAASFVPDDFDMSCVRAA